MMCSKEYMELAENSILHTYNRFPVVLEKGEGVYLYDLDGKKYLDFGAGIAVADTKVSCSRCGESMRFLAVYLFYRGCRRRL